MSEMTEKERRLREVVTHMKERLLGEQEIINLIEKLIEILHQERCEHKRVGANDEGGTFCYDCKKKLT